ncbi:hypothetical protein VFPFJ_05125 [Purpureocillium lilacinum]|uniref:Uncharacterized protein n=1 Tax=Purpureocillium lilacinum TaxID=33203 RepID=A0A179H1Q7_PURLI|nr:hypothetical protein VFPFJ_05125 [Purpureocillium lilacinum]OAQ84175.1 hypothetical protein VFPBJ_02943 [Purpureocillium lilacinum]OAQ90966.1 hypothetical protein VFPFJ_05125 [Purpureocillium lilacinum]
MSSAEGMRDAPEANACRGWWHRSLTSVLKVLQQRKASKHASTQIATGCQWGYIAVTDPARRRRGRQSKTAGQRTSESGRGRHGQ